MKKSYRIIEDRCQKTSWTKFAIKRKKKKQTKKIHKEFLPLTPKHKTYPYASKF